MALFDGVAQVFPIWVVVTLLFCRLLNFHQKDQVESHPQSPQQHISERKLHEKEINISTINQNNITANKIIRCRQSMFEIWNKCCINNLYSQYLDEIGFKYVYQHSAKSHIVPNIKLLRISDVNDPNNNLCFGLRIQSNAQSMEKSQENSKKYIDLTSLYHKSKLHTIIKQYTSVNNIDIEFLPKTYSLDNKYERRAFFRNLPCEDNDQHLWIFKTNLHGGSGIHLINNPLTMRRLFWRDDDIEYEMAEAKPGDYHCNAQYIARFDASFIINEFGLNVYQPKNPNDPANAIRKNTIVQEFISNPFLINNRKFHIRVFVMIPSLNPYIVLYGNGFLILAGEHYDKYHPDKTNAITNRAISKQINKNNNNTDIEWSWSFDQFKQYLEERQISNIDLNIVQQKIKQIINITFSSAISDRVNSKRIDTTLFNIHSHSYQYAVFAVDLLLTNQGELKLLEVQNAPKTSVIPAICNDNHWACQFGREIVKETVDLAINIAYQKTQKSQVTQDSVQNTINHYEVILFNDFKKFQPNPKQEVVESVEYYDEFNVGEF